MSGISSEPARTGRADVTGRAPTVCHAPAWNDAYQRHLMEAQRRLGWEAHFGQGVSRLGLDVSFLAALVRGAVPHVLHIHWQHPFLVGDSLAASRVRAASFLAQVALLRVLGRRIVWTVHNLKNHENRFVAHELASCRVLSHLANHIIVHCEAARRAVLDNYRVRDETKVVVIPHGAFTESARPEERGSARARLDLPDRARVFLFFGLIRPYKGLPELIEAFESITLPNAVLLVAGRCGDPGLEADLRSRSSERLRLRLGYVPDEEVGQLLSAADVVVYPYRDILTSGGVITAMSYGKAVIAPTLGCVPETISPEGAFLYDGEGASGLLAALERAADTPDPVLDEMGAANLAACEPLDWTEIARRHLSLYQPTDPSGSNEPGGVSS